MWGALGCKKPRAIPPYKSETLKIEQLTANTFLHVSYISTEKWGDVPCNGLIVIDNGEALVFDTPVHNSDSKELLNWIEETLKCQTIGIIATHFHRDCLGGLKEFHSQKIPSYAITQTIELAKRDSVILPQTSFDVSVELSVGNQKVVNEFLGEGHTRDNIVCYFPSEKVLFGGCLVKEIGAGKGNLADANIQDWSKTVTNVKSKYNAAKIIVPGHGKPGGLDLLDYTIKLFNREQEED